MRLRSAGTHIVWAPNTPPCVEDEGKAGGDSEDDGNGDESAVAAAEYGGAADPRLLHFDYREFSPSPPASLPCLPLP
jgi:hypothetical protein